MEALGLNPSKANILINNDHEACLADFGLVMSLQVSATVTTTLKGTLRWMAPELLKSSDPEGGVPTRASDVYALAMVFYEVRAKNFAWSWKGHVIRL